MLAINDTLLKTKSIIDDFERLRSMNECSRISVELNSLFHVNNGIWNILLFVIEDLSLFILKFKWDFAKFSANCTIPEIVRQLHGASTEISNLLTKRYLHFVKLKQEYQNQKR